MAPSIGWRCRGSYSASGLYHLEFLGDFDDFDDFGDFGGGFGDFGGDFGDVDSRISTRVESRGPWRRDLDSR